LARSEPQTAAGEEREKIVGVSDVGRLLAVAVVIALPDNDAHIEDVGFIRIVSARRATPTERVLYANAKEAQSPAP
jgi:uncharacterized DUF497 family protein